VGTIFSRGDDDVDAGQGLGQVAIALVGDDHRLPGLGDQHVGAGDPDLGLEVFLAQDAARLSTTS
jgi:hypothetical protein